MSAGYLFGLGALLFRAVEGKEPTTRLTLPQTRALLQAITDDTKLPDLPPPAPQPPNPVPGPKPPKPWLWRHRVSVALTTAVTITIGFSLTVNLPDASSGHSDAAPTHTATAGPATTADTNSQTTTPSPSTSPSPATYTLNGPWHISGNGVNINVQSVTRVGDTLTVPVVVTSTGDVSSFAISIFDQSGDPLRPAPGSSWSDPQARVTIRNVLKISIDPTSPPAKLTLSMKGFFWPDSQRLVMTFPSA